MKKLVIIIILLFASIHIGIDAKQLIITINEGNNYILEEEGMLLVENNVNWNKTGKYLVEYYNLLSKDFFKKDVIVTTKQNLIEGIKEISLNHHISTKVNIKGILYINEFDYFIYGAIDNGFYPYQSQNESEFAYIAYYKNSVLEWEKRIFDIRYGVIKDVCVTNKGIAIIGDYDSPSNKRNIFIMELNMSGKILNQKEFLGNGDDFGHKIFFQNNLIYFVGTTNSNDRDYLFFTNRDSNVIVGYISLQNLKEYLIIPIGNDGNDLFKDACFYNNKIYILMYFSGNGYYMVDNEKDFYGLVTIDYQIEFSNLISLTKYNINGLTKLGVVNGLISIINSNYNSNQINFLFFNNNLEYQKNENITYDKNIEIIDFYYKQSERINLVAWGRSKNTGDQYTIVSSLNNDFSNPSTFQKKLKENYYHLNQIFINSDGGVYFNYWDLLNQYIEFFSYYDMAIKENRIVNNNYIFHKQDIYLNGRVLEYQLYENRVTSNPFGLYTNLYIFETDKTIIYLPMDIYYLEYINIKGKQIYDIGVRLEFNGIGYLNHNLIKSGHIVNQEGNYLLEINGVNGEREVFTFVVQSLSVLTQEVDDNNIIFEFIRDDNPPLNNNNYVTIANNMLLKEDYTIDLFLVIGFAVLGILIGIIVPRRIFKVKKCLN